jgi:hypothetical protein
MLEEISPLDEKAPTLTFGLFIANIRSVYHDAIQIGVIIGGAIKSATEFFEK